MVDAGRGAIAREGTDDRANDGFRFSFLGGAGEMAARMRAFDWARTPLGAPAAWPQALKTLAGLMLGSTQPMFIAWGPSRVWLYNDAFIPILGRKHPQALGRAGLEVWDEARDRIGPLFEQVFGGEPVHMQDIELQLDRRGRLEESHFAFAYTPVRDEHGTVSGLFGVCIETTDQVLANRRLADAQDRQRRLFERAPGFIAILRGPRHVFEFANEAYSRLVGHRELLGRGVREAFPEIVDQGFFELLDKVYLRGERYVAHRVPVRLLRSGSTQADEYFLDFIYEPIVDEHGATTGIFVEGHDVTEAYRAETALRASERRQALLVELGDRLRELDDPADISYAAAELLGKALGVSRAGYGTIDAVAETVTIDRDWNAPGIRSLAGVLHFRDYGSYIDDLKRGETVVFADARLDPRTRETAGALEAISARSVVNMPVTEQSGFVALLYLNNAAVRDWLPEELALIREVAERTRTAVARRRAEQALLALTASLEQQVAERTAERDRVWRNSRDLLVVLGADAVLRAVNPAWTRILGHEPSQVVGRSFLDLVGPEDRQLAREALEAAARRQDLTDFESRHRHADGSLRWVSWQTSAEGGTVYAYGRDVTAHKEQARALAQAEEILRERQKLEAMGELTGGVAHDFNNLLAIVSNNLHLHRHLSPGCAASPQLDAIARAADTGARLTRQLLAFARRQAIQPEVLDLRRELAELLQVIRVTLGGRIEARLEIEERVPFIEADRSELQLALINLAMNSRDAMPGGGVLAIRVRRAAAPASETGQADGPWVAIAVSDDGEGIAPELLSRVIEPFFTTKAPGRGTGLGLSQVYGFVTQAGGRLEIASDPGASTTVTMLLPGTAGSPADAPPEAATAVQAIGARVLLVEDNVEVSSTTAELLQVAGCEVVRAGSGDQARSFLESDDGADVDLVLTDIVMPGELSGVALARWIERARPGLPVLLATGYSTEVAAARLQGLKVMQKPVTPAALVEALRRALGR